MKLRIEYKKTHVEFGMKDATNEVAQKVIDILNSNLPYNKEKLKLWENLDR